METNNLIAVKQIEWFDQRFYKVDFGDNNFLYYPSVTTKLQATSKPFLATWRGDIGNREANLRVKQAADRGSRIHYGWYLMTTGGAVIYNPFQRPNYNKDEIKDIEAESNGILILEDQGEMWDIVKLEKWHKAVNPKIEASELIVYSAKNNEAGQLDSLMYIKEGEYMINGAKPLYIPEGRYVVDLKTGKTVGNDAYMQVAAYANCYGEMTKGKEKIAGGLIIHTGSKTKTGIEGLSTHLRLKDEMKNDYENFRSVADVWSRLFSKEKPEIMEFPSLIRLENQK